MKSNILNLAISFLLFTLKGNTQTPIDALRLSSIQQAGGTARCLGVGGALGALGADYGAIGINPAGLASFRTSEFVFTPGYSAVKTDAILENNINPNVVIIDTKTKFYLNNIGLVISKRSSTGDWTTRNWTIGLNRLKTFDASYYFKGDSKGTIINRFQENANNNPNNLNEFEEGLAYSTGAIYHKNNDNSRFASDFDGYGTLPITKSQQGITSGRINELVLGYAANYKEKIQIGAAIGVPFTSFYDNRVYKEEDIETAKDFGKVPSFKELSFKENYGVTGRGINAKIGVIFKPTQSFRLGASVQTPNRYKLSEAFDNSFSYTYWQDSPSGAEEKSYSDKSPDGSFDYVIRTPWRITGSAAILAGKKGFVSVDAEFVDYSQMAFEYGVDYKDAEVDVNNDIKSQYVSTANIRLGGEITMDIFRFRAGVATSGLPVAVDNPNYFRDASKTYSLGAGLREKKFYFDLAYQFTRNSDIYSPYRAAIIYEQPKVNRTQNSGQFIATLGFKF